MGILAGIKAWEWIVILVIVLLVFGIGRISKLGGELGKGIRSFREGLKGEDKNDDDENDHEASDQ